MQPIETAPSAFKALIQFTGSWAMQPIETWNSSNLPLNQVLFTGSWAMQPIETVPFSPLLQLRSLQGVGQCSPLKPYFYLCDPNNRVYRELGNAAH